MIEEPPDGPAFCDPTFVVEPPGELGGVTVFIGPTEENGKVVLMVGSAFMPPAVSLVLGFFGVFFLVSLLLGRSAMFLGLGFLSDTRRRDEQNRKKGGHQG